MYNPAKSRPKSANYSTHPELESTNHTNFNGTQTTYFNVDKKHTHPYFNKTRVGSARKIVVRNGVPLAITFDIRNRKGNRLNNYKYTLKKLPENHTIYQRDYCSKKYDMHCGMDNKPLVPYDPNSYRNLLPIDNGFRSMNNKSFFDLGSNSLINRKQWTSTYRDCFRKPIVTYQPNSGIRADTAKLTHYKLNNIEYA
jgi:hypothetical protein